MTQHFVFFSLITFINPYKPVVYNRHIAISPSKRRLKQYFNQLYSLIVTFSTAGNSNFGFATKKQKQGPKMSHKSPESSLIRSYSKNLHHITDKGDYFIPTGLLAKDYVVFSHPTMKSLADNLCSALVNRHNNLACSRGEITWKSFNDGFPDIFIHNIQSLVNRDVIFVASFNTPGDIFEQISVCALFPSYRIRSLSFILPYSPVATMERSSVAGEVVTAVSLAKMFGIISMNVELYLVDLHTFHNLHYFPNHIYPIFVHSAHRLKQILLRRVSDELARLESPPLLTSNTSIRSDGSVSSVSPISSLTRHNSAYAQSIINTISIVFPDSGAFQRYRFIVPPFDHVICYKIRDGDKRHITITQGADKIDGRDLYLIDDLIHSGGTIKETINGIYENYKPKSISLFITHGVFERDTWKPFVEMWEKGLIKDFYLCDTTPQAIKLHGVGPFQVISVADDLSDVLYHNRQLQYDELQRPTVQQQLPTIGGDDSDDIQLSPVENEYHCKECTALFYRHAQAIATTATGHAHVNDKWDNGFGE
jgi:phosphoribosylpyrophosphate synthetase